MQVSYPRSVGRGGGKRPWERCCPIGNGGQVALLGDCMARGSYSTNLLLCFSTVIDRIPSFRYSAMSKDSSNGKCVVCMMDYSNREKLRRLPCNHDFHSKCVDRWLRVGDTVPLISTAQIMLTVF